MSSKVLDYEYLPDRPENPVSESTLHAQWGHLLIGAISHTLAGSDVLVTGNVRWDPNGDGPRTAPDVMVIPGMAGEHFGVYAPGPGDPVPSVCIEIRSPSNTDAIIERRTRAQLELGVAEVYVLDPWEHTVDRATLDGDRLVFSDARGVTSEALGMTFARSRGQLAVCCPAGLIVHPGDDPYGWIVEERLRADAEARRADREAERADREAQRAEREARRADEAAERADRNAALLRAHGIEPPD